MGGRVFKAFAENGWSGAVFVTAGIGGATWRAACACVAAVVAAVTAAMKKGLAKSWFILSCWGFGGAGFEVFVREDDEVALTVLSGPEPVTPAGLLAVPVMVFEVKKSAERVVRV
jgi:hypothetical protein